MQKIIALYHMGEDDLAQGMNILCAHIDSPRLDIKQNPLYEDTDLAYLDTQLLRWSEESISGLLFQWQCMA